MPADAPGPPHRDPLGAILALCRAADPAPGERAARALSRLLATAARAGGAEAGRRIDRALADVAWRERAPEGRAAQGRDALAAWTPGEAGAEDEQRLVDKLDSGGKLRPSLLLSALREGRANLFHAALGALCGVEAKALKLDVARSDERLAWALRAAGVDRSVFPTVLRRLRALDGGSGRPPGTEAAAVEAALRATPDQARAHLRAGAPA